MSGTTKDLEIVQACVDNYDTVVFFNGGYDLLWLWKLGIDTTGVKVWDCQVAEFILNKQLTPYPSLEVTAQKYLGQSKLDVVKTEYWEKGIDTDQIPANVLEQYAEQDAVLTRGVYEAQLKLIPAHQKSLFSLAMQDMYVLAEMRHEGMKYDQQYAENKQKEILEEIERTKRELDLLHNVPSFNWASPDHLSALLYGGVITEKVRIPVGFYKSGAKVGHVKFSWNEVKHNLPRIYKPLKHTEAKKEGVWSTSEDILQKLDDGTKLISGILHIRELSKLYGTYFLGIPKRVQESNWLNGMVYGQFHQCVTVTGRLSSSAPNLQNMPPEVMKMFVTRFE